MNIDVSLSTEQVQLTRETYNSPEKSGQGGIAASSKTQRKFAGASDDYGNESKKQLASEVTEIDYRLDSDWNVGFGAAWRSTRFRLGTANAVANGIGEERGMPVFLRASRNFGKQAALNLYAGVITNGQLRVEDATGNTLRRVDFDTAPIVGATFTLRY